MHGTPGARRQIPEAARLAAEELDVRLIGIDRPGVGDSTSFRYESLLDFPADLATVADRLGVERFAMIGLSGGGPYALACAHAMPDRVAAVAVLGGVAPTQGPDAPRRRPRGVRRPVRRRPSVVPRPAVADAQRAHPRPATARLAGLRPLRAAVPGGRSQRCFGRPEIKAMFLDDLLGGSRRGIRAPIYDIMLFTRAWGFSVRDVQVPVRWWHGDSDNIVPLAHGEHLVPLIPDAELYIRPGESHLGGLGAAEEVLDTLLALWDAERADPA